jgi:hypothetical protein
MAEAEKYEGNGWSHYEKLVLYRLDSVQQALEALKAQDLKQLKDDVDALKRGALISKVRLATLSSLAGAVGSVIALLVEAFRHYNG